MIDPQSPIYLAIRANALAYQRGDVLADFEITLITDVHRRVVRDGGVMTASERQVIEEAVAAMAAAPRQDLTQAGLAA